MPTSLSTSFEELIDRARHLPSITFEKTRGGVETIDRMLTNARPPPCIVPVSYNILNNCHHSIYEANRAEVIRVVGDDVSGSQAEPSKVQVCLRDSRVRYAVIGVSRL